MLAAFSVSLGSLVVGFSSAYTSPALVSMTDRNVTGFEVTPQAVCVKLVLDLYIADLIKINL